MRIISLSLTIISLFSHVLFAEEQPLPNVYEPLKPSELITEFPRSTWLFLKSGVSAGVLPWLTIAGSSALFYAFDPALISSVQKKGKHFVNEDYLYIYPKSERAKLIFLPKNLGGLFHFFGDKVIIIFSSTGFLLTGSFSDSNKMQWTGIQLLQGAVLASMSTYLLKRSFGREEPYIKTSQRGTFRPFRSYSEFKSNTIKYDALPSGHMTIASVFWTVIRENYPQYDSVLLPLQITTMSLLGLQMMNKGVHWASDYPLAIAIGYNAGKTVARLGKKEPLDQSDHQAENYNIYPVVTAEGLGTGIIFYL